jgi:hypothetical protein
MSTQSAGSLSTLDAMEKALNSIWTIGIRVKGRSNNVWRVSSAGLN